MGGMQTKTLDVDTGLGGGISFSQLSSRVDKVKVNGIQRTKDDIILDGISVLFKAQNFQEVLSKVKEAKENLQRIGAFSVIEAKIDTSKGPEATPKGLEVTFHVKEISRISGSLNTSVGSNDGSVTLIGRTPNILGRGEKFQLDYNYGVRKTNGIHLSLSKPVWKNGVYGYLTGSVFHDGIPASWAGFHQTNRGVLIDMLMDHFNWFKHNIQYEACWRELKCLNRTTAFEVREDAGHTLKSALRYILTYDNRDSSILPYEGQLVRFTSEYAGLGGNVNFLKNELHIQANKNLIGDFVLQGAFKAGILSSPKGQIAHNISDKFFLGGPLDLRGFEMNSCGPRSDNCFLGAESYWSSGVHLYTPLPFTNPRPGTISDFFRTHLFANCGNIGSLGDSNDFNEMISQMFTSYRASVGVGIILRIADFARFELNYCHILGHSPKDKTQCIQFGVGISYL